VRFRKADFSVVLSLPDASVVTTVTELQLFVCTLVDTIASELAHKQYTLLVISLTYAQLLHFTLPFITLHKLGKFAEVIQMRPTKYFTPTEVSLHNTLGDLWVSYLGKVYDLTPLVNEFKGKFSNTNRLLGYDSLINNTLLFRGCTSEAYH
jgi:hypothetical protein